MPLETMAKHWSEMRRWHQPGWKWPDHLTTSRVFQRWFELWLWKIHSVTQIIPDVFILCSNPGHVHRFYAMSTQKLGMPCLSEMNSVFSRSRSAMRTFSFGCTGHAPKAKQMQQYREFMFNSCLKTNPQKYIVSLRVSKKNMTASGFLETSIEWRKTGNFYLPSATPNPPKPPPFPKKNTCWAFEVRNISLNLRLVQVTKFLSQRNWREKKRQHYFTIKSKTLYGHEL